MTISQNLIDKGFSLNEVSEHDLNDYLVIKRICYKKYVDQYFGGWIEDTQIMMNTDTFEKTRKQSCFQKIILKGETVGFCGYNELEDSIGSITIQMLGKAQNQGLGSFFLKYIVSLSIESNKPILLKVFKSNPARNLYEKFNFKIYDETQSHYLMRYDHIYA